MVTTYLPAGNGKLLTLDPIYPAEVCLEFNAGQYRNPLHRFLKQRKAENWSKDLGFRVFCLEGTNSSQGTKIIALQAVVRTMDCLWPAL